MSSSPIVATIPTGIPIKDFSRQTRALTRKHGDDLCGDAPDPCLFWDMTHAEQERIRARADRIEKGPQP